MIADLHAEATVSWAGTSPLIAATAFQVLHGRESDLFGGFSHVRGDFGNF